MKHSILNPVIARVGDRDIPEDYRDEINRAINNVKRTAFDKWFRKEWYRETARIGRRMRRQESINRTSAIDRAFAAPRKFPYGNKSRKRAVASPGNEPGHRGQGR